MERGTLPSRYMAPTIPKMPRFSSAIAIEHKSQNSLIYKWHEDIEDLERYHVGGYHPVHLQDEYSGGRYRIVHKLGYGAYWLARDQHMYRYVALKILVAEFPQTGSESRILRHLNDSHLKHGVRNYVSPLLDDFYVDGPNGRHLCLVNETASCSIAASKEASTNWMFLMGIARAIAAQAVLGLKDIHSGSVVHGAR